MGLAVLVLGERLTVGDLAKDLEPLAQDRLKHTLQRPAALGGRCRDGPLDIAGRGLDPNEHPADAAVRECFEEPGPLACLVDPSSLSIIRMVISPTTQRWRSRHLLLVDRLKRMAKKSRDCATSAKSNAMPWH